ncbi:F-box/LRR-repeat protein At4g14096-like isoform X2 [Rhododendron vialii]|uniref:F-box/LRR-repeat protein At4g14096-like isoform X2 n=1 Tax=Rhododendron vialii TaxID=182163 RepID=UPI00265FEE83|nr:F-box/LRR-repeat protein At4g14096-like isoform X2 [Rhododendron vialii]
MAVEPTSYRSLNDFSDHLLLHILSFLPALDALRTAPVCRKWQTLLPSLPSLNFDYSLFPPSASPSDTRRRFADFVDLFLLRRPPTSPLLNLRFQFDFGDYLHSSQIDSWIHHAVNHGVTEIDADFFIHRDYQVFDQADGGYSYNECYFTFYFNSIKNSRVRVLKLSRCELILPLGFSTISSFKFVQSLYLDQIYLNDEMVSDLISGCPNLESLVLEYCCDMKELRIRSTRLKRLSLLYFHSQDEEEESVEVCALNLRSFRIVCFEMGMYSMEGTTGLDEAYVEFMHEERHYKYWSKVVRLLSGVKHLVVENWWIRLHSSMEISSEDLVFNNLTSVELRTGYTTYDLLGIAALLECSPNLEILTVSDLFKIDEDWKNQSQIYAAFAQFCSE